jgi:hypothetical protein
MDAASDRLEFRLPIGFQQIPIRNKVPKLPCATTKSPVNAILLKTRAEADTKANQLRTQRKERGSIQEWALLTMDWLFGVYEVRADRLLFLQRAALHLL